MKNSLRFEVNVYPSTDDPYDNLPFDAAVELIQNFLAQYSTKALRYDIKEVVEKRIVNAIKMCYPYVMFNTNAGITIKCNILYTSDVKWTRIDSRIFVSYSHSVEYRTSVETFEKLIDKVLEMTLRYNMRKIEDKNNQIFLKSHIEEMLSPLSFNKMENVVFFLTCGVAVVVSKMKYKTGYCITEVWNAFQYYDGHEINAHCIAALMLRNNIEPIWISNTTTEANKVQRLKIKDLIVTYTTPESTKYLNDSSEFPGDNPERYYVG